MVFVSLPVKNPLSCKHGAARKIELWQFTAPRQVRGCPLPR